MKIKKTESIALEIPFTHRGQPSGWSDWNALSTLLIRIETDDGIVGYGEAFSYKCLPAVKAVFDHMLAPRLLNQDASDINGLVWKLQRELHLFGRYGIGMFALSGLDLALWDVAGKRAGLPLVRLLGGNSEVPLGAYASLFRYGDREVVAQRCQDAVEEGYHAFKLHEIQIAEVAAAREVVGEQAKLMVDTNCPWTPQQAFEMVSALEPYGLYWLEEPIWPPEDFAALARLQRITGMPLASGENLSTALEFQKMLDADAVSFAQPSVTKVGGVTEFVKVLHLAAARGIQLMPHSPYFGPGFLATLHLTAASPTPGLVEVFYLDLEASLYGNWTIPVESETGRAFNIPKGPGLGLEPDPDVVKTYRVT